MKRFAAIVLAAGRSRRFGAESKLLAQLGGRAVIGHALGAALDAGVGQVVVVCARADEALQAEVRAASATARLVLVQNDAMSDSLRAGLSALHDCAGAFVLLADMPFVDAQLLHWLAAAWDETALAAAPVHDGRRGNPVLLSARAFDLVRDLAGDQGLSGVLAARLDEVRLVEAGRECVTDIDTRADLDSARANWGDG